MAPLMRLRWREGALARRALGSRPPHRQGVASCHNWQGTARVPALPGRHPANIFMEICV